MLSLLKKNIFELCGCEMDVKCLEVFSESYLHETFTKTGLSAVSTLSSEKRLGNGHGWIEIGVGGRKQ